MKYRIVENPEGQFTPEKSEDTFVWAPLSYEYSEYAFGAHWPKYYNTVKKAQKAIEDNKEYRRKNAVKRVVYQE